jgi:ribosome-associated translation inhibitor RaiA
MAPTTNVSRPHIELRLHEAATVHQYRELGAFVRECIDRLERTFGQARWWTIKIDLHRVCYSCELTAELDHSLVQASGTGFDGAIAGWEAFRKIEGSLRKAHALRKAVQG